MLIFSNETSTHLATPKFMSVWELKKVKKVISRGLTLKKKIYTTWWVKQSSMNQLNLCIKSQRSTQTNRLDKVLHSTQPLQNQFVNK